MNLGGASPEHEGGAGQQIDRATAKPIDALAAERAASFAEVEARQGDLARLDARTGEIGTALMDLYADDGSSDLMQPFVDDGEFPELAAQRLCQYEQEQRKSDPEFDVTRCNPRKVAFLLRRMTSENDDAEAKQTKVANNAKYETFQDHILKSPGYKKLDTNVARLEFLIAAEGVPEAEKSKFQALLDIHKMATNPGDSVIILARINELDLSQPVPSTSLFVETTILTDQNLSDNFRDAVSSKFNVPNPRIKTGGQVDASLDARNENGEPLYTRESPIDLGGAAAFENPDGSRAVGVRVPGRGNRDIPWRRNESSDVISTKISLAKIWGRNEWSGQTDFFGEGIDIETHIMSQTDPEKLRKVQNVMSALFGGTRGFDAVIVQDNEADFLGWFNQFSSTKGDASQKDIDAKIAVENRTNLGLHSNGDPQKIDYAVLREAAKYAKSQYGVGEPDYFALQLHLHDLFPDRVPLTEKNAVSAAGLSS